MSKKMVVIVIVAGALAAAWVFFVRGDGGPPDTTAGREARKIDDHVTDLFDNRNHFEARELLTVAGESPKRHYDSITLMSFEQTKKVVEDYYTAGAPEVNFVHVDKSNVNGLIPHAMAITLPNDKAKRAAIFTVAADQANQIDRPVPTDVRQKYIYMNFTEDWSPDKEPVGFLP